MNFIRNHLARVKVAFLLLALLGQSSHAALTAEALAEIKQETLSIYSATRTMIEDRKEEYEEIQRNLSTLTPEELTHLTNQHSSKKISKAHQREAMETACTQVIQIAQQSLQITLDAEKNIQKAAQAGITELFQDMLTQLPDVLENRKQSKGGIPSTVPGMMQLENPHRLRLAEKSYIERWNEASIMRLFSKALSPEDLSAAFSPYLSDKAFSGYFTILKAYIFGLVESPPLPDHWQLQETKDSRPSDMRGRLTKKTLLEGPLKRLEEEESQARLALEAYDTQPAPLTEAELQEALEEERKLEKKRAAARAKKARQRAKKKAGNLLDAGHSSADLGVEEEISPTPLTLPDCAATTASSTDLGVDEDISENKNQKEISCAMALAREEWAQPKAQKAQAIQIADEEQEIAADFHLHPKVQPLMDHFWTAPKMEWKDFRKLFTSQDIDFGIIPSGGSIRKLLYPASLKSVTGRRSFIVHEPHGAFSTVGSRTLSAVRKWMEEDFGWTAEMFRN
ncbi:hypothetical protein OAN21_02745 [Alphaproteobacteria bacterium]|nr:hypothetical protein [Alphaproteobacteria bacterium]